MINRARMLAEFYELIRIKCSTRQEREVADLVKAKLAGLGLETEEDDAGGKIGGNCGNLFAYRKGNMPEAPVLMFAAHLDCVEPCANIQPQLKNGMITSAGDTILGADDKAGVAAILEALRVVDERNVACGDIQVVFTVAEEGGLNGSKNMDRSRLRADLGFELDSSTKPGCIITRAPGQNRIKVTIQGKTAHAGLEPEKGINAIVVAGHALTRVKNGRIDEETTANIGIIHGGRATNIVPDQVEIICEARSRNHAKLEELTRSIQETFEQVAKENGGQAVVDVQKAYDPYILADDAPAVVLAAKASAMIGLTSRLEATGGGSDANFYNSYGVPCTVLGVGMQKVHTNEEFIMEEDLYDTARLVIAIIEQAAKMKKRAG